MLSRSVAAGALMSLLGVACASAPPYSGWTPEQLFEHGQRAFDEGDWSEARRAFERLVLTFPGFDQAVEARHYLARAFYADDEYPERGIGVHPHRAGVPGPRTHPRSVDLGLCRSYAAMSPHPQRDQQYTVQARTTCQNVAGDFQGMPVGDSAAVVARKMHVKLAEKSYGEGHFYFQRNILESAELVFLDLLDIFPDTEVAPKAVARLIDIYQEWEWDEQEEEFRTRLLETYPDSPEAEALEQAVASDTVSVVRSRAPPGPGRLMAWTAARG